MRHSYVRGWHLPGGGVERHESLEQALGRELLEEAGLGIRGKPKLHGIFSNFERFEGDHIAVYIVNDWERIRGRSSKFEILEQRFSQWTRCLLALSRGQNGGWLKCSITARSVVIGKWRLFRL